MATALVITPAAVATPIDINFTRAVGVASNVCSPNPTPTTPSTLLTSWAQNRFNVASGGFDWNPNQGGTNLASVPSLTGELATFATP
jgi:hypothetical protein